MALRRASSCRICCRTKSNRLVVLLMSRALSAWLSSKSVMKYGPLHAATSIIASALITGAKIDSLVRFADVPSTSPARFANSTTISSVTTSLSDF